MLSTTNTVIIILLLVTRDWVCKEWVYICVSDLKCDGDDFWVKPEGVVSDSVFISFISLTTLGDPSSLEVCGIDFI